MKIVIENFRNIERMELDIDESKTNFIYGISGSGKSSLIRAVSYEPNEEDVPLGNTAAIPAVLIDGGTPTYNTKIYDESSVKQLILEPIDNELAYNAMVGDESVLTSLELQYGQGIDDLRAFLQPMLEKRDQITKVLKAFGEREKGSTFDRRAGISKLKNEIEKTKVGTAKEVISSNDKYVSFITTGTKVNDDFENQKCPFCKKKLSDARYQKITEISAITKTTFKLVFDNIENITELGMTVPEWTKKRSVTAFEKELDTQRAIRDSLVVLIDFCTAMDGDIRQYDIPKRLTVNKELLDAMPDLRTPVDAINTSMTAYRSLVGKMKTEFNKLVKGAKIDALNQSIKEMGIPYHFAAENIDRNSRTISYLVRHVDCPNTETMGTRLSSGEKNVLALLLFMQDSSSNILLFDDPVSSYDGYRRSQLYKRIAALKGHTILVCSHDQSFVKYAVVDKYKMRGPNASIGQIKMLTNIKGVSEFTDIKKEHFGSVRELVIEHLKKNPACSHYRMVINLRLLCEIDNYARKGKKKAAAWGYTSAILHQADRTAVIEQLEGKDFSEEEILALFKAEYSFDVPPMPTMCDTTDWPSYTEFEKAILAREIGTINKISKNVLNDLVHLNNHLAIGLDPYEFTDYPAYLDEEIETILNDYFGLPANVE